MSEELQNDTVEVEISGNTELKTTETVIENQNGAELATDSGTGHEQKQNVDVTKVEISEGAQAAINKKHWEFKEQERKTQDLQNQLDEIAKKDADKLATTYANDPVQPKVPTYPTDEFADNFDEQVAQYRKDIEALPEKLTAYNQELQVRANYNAGQNAITQQAEDQQLHQQQEANLKFSKAVSVHKERASRLNIGDTEMQYAEQALMNSGADIGLINEILTKEDSPLIMKHLAANPTDMLSLVSNPYQVGVVLKEISDKAKTLQPAITNTPEPVETLSGGGVDPNANEYPNSDGATFE